MLRVSSEEQPKQPCSFHFYSDGIWTQFSQLFLQHGVALASGLDELQPALKLATEILRRQFPFRR
jgi:hypothetical protein